MLFLHLQPVHSSSTARPPDPDLRSRSSISSLLPCYFCSSCPSTARPPPVHRILTFNLAPPSLASSHAISAAPARPQPVHTPCPPNPGLRSRSSISSLLPCYFCTSSPSTARPPDPDLQSRSSISSLLPCYFCSSSPSTARPPDPDLRSRSSISSLFHAISAAPARPQLVHRPSTGSWHSISLLP